MSLGAVWPCCSSGTVAAVYMPFPSPPPPRSNHCVCLAPPRHLHLHRRPYFVPAVPPSSLAPDLPLPFPLAPLQSWHSLYKARYDEFSTQAQPATKTLKDVTNRLAEATRPRPKVKEGAAGKKVSCFGVRLL